MERTDPSLSNSASLPDLSGDYPLKSEEISAYQREGHLCLRGVCTPEEIAAYRPAIFRAVARFQKPKPPMEQRDTYGRAFVQVGFLSEKDEEVRRFTLARRFGRIAAELMGVNGVRLYHDQALFKEAGGGHTPWHQDQYYWPLDTEHTITMWMPLVDVSLEMGPVTFASGSHKAGYLGPLAISDESQSRLSRFVSEQNYPLQSNALKAGDATFHAGWTLHCAPGNQTDRVREVMTVIYYADGTRILSELGYPARKLDLEACHPGVQPGELAISPLNPLIYSSAERIS